MELTVANTKVILDPDHFKIFKDKKLSIRQGYAMFEKQLLHRTIMDCPDDKVIDHINQNKLDNRRANLRICTIAENNLNKKLSSKSTTGLTGVHFYKPLEKYVAYISKDNKRHHLGYYDTPEEAYYKYVAVAKNLHGEYTAERIKNIEIEPCEIKPKEYKSPQYALDYYHKNKAKRGKYAVLRMMSISGKRPKQSTIDKHKLTEDEIKNVIRTNA